jgi:hypothetical protein
MPKLLPVDGVSRPLVYMTPLSELTDPDRRGAGLGLPALAPPACRPSANVDPLPGPTTQWDGSQSSATTVGSVLGPSSDNNDHGRLDSLGSGVGLLDVGVATIHLQPHG